MSHAKRVHERQVPLSARARQEEEEEDMDIGEDLAETEAMDEARERVMDEDDILKALTKGSQEDVAQNLVMYLETHPDDPQARAMVKFYVRKLYIKTGGLPFNKGSPIPFDLDSLSNLELQNVLENMLIYSARSKQKDLVGKALNTVTNLGYIVGGAESSEVVNQVQSDESLRSSLIEVFLGTKFSPLLSLLISGSSHLSNLARNYFENKRNGKRDTSTQGGGQSSSSASTGTVDRVSSNGGN